MKSVRLLPLLALLSIAALSRASPGPLPHHRHRARAPPLGHPPRSLPRSRQVRRPQRRARLRLGRHPLRPRLPHPASRLRSPPANLRRQGHRHAPCAARTPPSTPPDQQQPHPLLVTVSGDLLVAPVRLPLPHPRPPRHRRRVLRLRRQNRRLRRSPTPRNLSPHPHLLRPRQ